MVLLTPHSNGLEATCITDNNMYFQSMLLYAQNARDWGPSGIHPRAPFIFDIYEW